MSTTEIIEVVTEGPAGPAGAGLPVGGLVGQIPVKATTTDHDVNWESPRQPIGLYIYADSQYDTATLNVPGTGVFVDVPNDGLGALSANFPLEGISDMWVTADQNFRFDNLEPGGNMALRVDMTVTTSSPNQNVMIKFVGGIGGPAPFELSLIDNTYKSASTHPVNRYTPVFVLDANSRAYPGKIQIASDSPLEVQNIRFFCDVSRYYPIIS